MSIVLDAEPEVFTPGQFVNLALEIGDERLKRAYSLASPPGSPFEFLISRVEDGTFTSRLFELELGDSIEVERRASGFFTLDEVPEFATELWLLATGTGLGPFMSMLRTPQLIFPRFSRVIVVHGVRRVQHLAYRDELEQICRGDSRLRYLRVISREDAPPGALAGRITQHLQSGQLERAADLQLSTERSHLMLCGNPEMIREGTAVLKQRGLSKHRRRKPGHISTEKYW